MLVKLIFLSLLVGAFLAFLDITPVRPHRERVQLDPSVFDLSFETVLDIGRWILYGAIIVVPALARLRLARPAMSLPSAAALTPRRIEVTIGACWRSPCR